MSIFTDKEADAIKQALVKATITALRGQKLDISYYEMDVIGKKIDENTIKPKYRMLTMHELLIRGATFLDSTYIEYKGIKKRIASVVHCEVQNAVFHDLTFKGLTETQPLNADWFREI